jgi:hypothetical protein
METIERTTTEIEIGKTKEEPIDFPRVPEEEDYDSMSETQEGD